MKKAARRAGSALENRRVIISHGIFVGKQPIVGVGCLVLGVGTKEG